MSKRLKMSRLCSRLDTVDPIASFSMQKLIKQLLELKKKMPYLRIFPLLKTEKKRKDWVEDEVQLTCLWLQKAPWEPGLSVEHQRSGWKSQKNKIPRLVSHHISPWQNISFLFIWLRWRSWHVKYFFFKLPIMTWKKRLVRWKLCFPGSLLITLISAGIYRLEEKEQLQCFVTTH